MVPVSPTISPKSMCSHGLHTPPSPPLMPATAPRLRRCPAHPCSGRMCECPMVEGIQYEGVEGNECVAVGPRRCMVNKDGCWRDTRHGDGAGARVPRQRRICRFAF
ncbi:hypothetical protein QYE76_036346 [Lolium multiflorum]|uniref:Uncharacterized protein n=1 Tax=Lolium multiflorum TaxID=4521 RepID=A0AAD8R4R2_LOLMU|nr:hypothetical protein QYE76_036346 [Lolium multiflorum]